MNVDKAVMQHLATALRMELTAVNQYLLHSHILRDWGFDKLSNKMREEMAEEAGHADLLIERILFHGGEPDLSTLDKVTISETVPELLEKDLIGERAARAAYANAATDCEKAGDFVSRDLFVSLISDEEGHIEWLEKQLRLMKHLGEGMYLQSQMGAAGDENAD